MINNDKKTILELFNQPEKHPSAVKLFAKLQKQNKIITLENLHEILNSLEKSEKIESLLDATGQKRYHLKAEKHCHFICSECGLVKNIELENGAINMLTSYVQEKIRTFAKIEKINLSFEGKCFECLKNK